MRKVVRIALRFLGTAVVVAVLLVVALIVWVGYHQEYQRMVCSRFDSQFRGEQTVKIKAIRVAGKYSKAEITDPRQLEWLTEQMTSGIGGSIGSEESISENSEIEWEDGYVLPIKVGAFRDGRRMCFGRFLYEMGDEDYVGFYRITPVGDLPDWYVALHTELLKANPPPVYDY